MKALGPPLPLQSRPWRGSFGVSYPFHRNSPLRSRLWRELGQSLSRSLDERGLKGMLLDINVWPYRVWS